MVAPSGGAAASAVGASPRHKAWPLARSTLRVSTPIIRAKSIVSFRAAPAIRWKDEARRDLHAAKTAPLEDVPHALYGVVGTLATWLPIVKGNRTRLEGYYRQEWQRYH
jgi:hypothetical protein